MCGIIGVAGALEYKDELLVKRLLLLDYLRGTDSTGLAAVRKNNDVVVAKLASHPIDLFDMTKFKSALTGSSSKAFIGHNRAATKGEINGLNAHPYQCGHITGVHNGTLHHASFEELKKKLGEEYTTDSWAIFASIERFGIQETVSMLAGAWSLVWYDAEEDTLNFLRNKERPMWYGFTKEFDRIMWASEWEFIDAAVKTSKNVNQTYEMMVEEDTGYKYWATDVDIHFKFKMSDLTSKEKGKTRPKPVAKTLKGKDVAASCGGDDPFGRTRTSGYGAWVRGQFQPASTKTSANSQTTNSKTSHGGKKLAMTNVVSMYGTKENPLAGIITKEKFDQIAQYGCSWCQATVEYEDVGVSIFERDDIILCKECSTPSKDKEPATKIHTPNIQQLL